jgi:hypothetical protein
MSSGRWRRDADSLAALAPDEQPETSRIQDSDSRNVAGFEEILVTGHEHVGCVCQRVSQDHGIACVADRHGRRLGRRERSL